MGFGRDDLHQLTIHMAKTRARRVTVVGPNKGNQARRDRRREVGVEVNGEGGREARTSGQVDVVFGIGQWLGCLRQQGINGGGF